MSQIPGNPNPSVPIPNTPPPGSVSTPAAQLGPHAEPDDREEVYFEGSPPMRAMAAKFVMYVVIGLALLAIAIALAMKEKSVPWWADLALAVLGLISPTIPWLMVHSRRYRITNYRIDFDRGLLTRNIDTLELWHVEDLHFHQSMMDRILDVGTITVKSRDESMPTLIIAGIPKPRPLYESLKQRIIAVKRQRGVMKLDPG